MSLTVREQNRFIAAENRLISALDNLKTSDRVRKGDLNTAYKMLGKMESVANSKELLSHLSNRMNSDLGIDMKDSSKVKSFIDGLVDKLKNQDSKIYDKKFKQLNSIGSRIFQTSQKIEVDHLSSEISRHTNAANSKVKSAESEKKLVHDAIDKRNDAKQYVAKEKEELERITPDQISADQDKRINRLTRDINSSIDRLKVDIRRINKRGDKLVEFINEHGKTDVKNDFELAKTDKYLKRSMATAEYAQEKFGTKTIVVEGRRSYSATTTKKVLSDNGAEFLSRAKKYNSAENEVALIKDKIRYLESNRDAQIAAIKAEKRSPLQSKYDANIASYQNDYIKVGETGNRALDTIARNISFIDSAIKNSTVLKNDLEAKGERMADPGIQKLAARHGKNIGKLEVEKQKLETSYQRLVEAAKTDNNYVSDVESDSGSDYESHV